MISASTRASAAHLRHPVERRVVDLLDRSTPSMNCGNVSNCVHWSYAVRTGTSTSIDFDGVDARLLGHGVCAGEGHARTGRGRNGRSGWRPRFVRVGVPDLTYRPGLVLTAGTPQATALIRLIEGVPTAQADAGIRARCGGSQRDVQAPEHRRSGGSSDRVAHARGRRLWRPLRSTRRSRCPCY